MIRLIHGDALEQVRTLPEASIDLVLTDPPYMRPDLYGMLFRESVRVLKPSSYLVAYCGTMFVPQVLAQLSETEGLSYVWLLAILHKSMTNLWKWKILVRWRPLVLAMKPPLGPLPSWAVDLIYGSGKEKRYHVWGQSVNELCYLLEKLTAPGDTVLDPFAGGGSTLAACALLDRNGIGIEIDPDQCAAIRRHLCHLPAVLPFEKTACQDAGLFAEVSHDL